MHPGQCFDYMDLRLQFKQMLCCAGVERYYQIARCFRDEDLRSDRCADYQDILVPCSIWVFSRLKASVMPVPILSDNFHSVGMTGSWNSHSWIWRWLSWIGKLS